MAEREWVRELAGQTRPGAVIELGDIGWADLSERGHQTEFESDYSALQWLGLVNVGRRSEELLTWQGSAPQRLFVRPAPGTTSLRLTARGQRLEELVVDLTDANANLELFCSVDEVGVLRLHHGGARIAEYPSLASVHLRDTDLRNTVLRADAIAVTGRLQSSGHVGTRELVLDGEPEFVGGEVRAVDVHPLEDQQVQFALVGTTCHVVSLRPDSTLKLIDAMVLLGPWDPEQPREESRQITFAGRGSVVVTTTLSQPAFDPESPASLTLQLEPDAQVLDARGSTALTAAVRSSCTGARESPLKIARVSEVADAHLEHLDVYSLSVADLPALKKASRVVPWTPPRRRARALEDAMEVGGGSAQLRADKRAFFWERLVTIAKESHAPGSVQSELRLAALRARRRSLQMGREKVLLSVWSLIGSGERIALPLVWYAMISFVATPRIDRRAIRAHGYWDVDTVDAWAEVALSPLSFFRLAADPGGTTANLAQPSVLLLVRISGIILIVFSLLAMRKVVRTVD